MLTVCYMDLPTELMASVNPHRFKCAVIAYRKVLVCYSDGSMVQFNKRGHDLTDSWGMEVIPA